MLFNTLVSTTVAVCALLVPSALAQDDTTAAADVTLKFWARAGCNGNSGPERRVSAGQCIAVADANHAVKVINHRGPCRLVAWSAANCNGQSRELNANGCSNIPSAKSIKVKC